MKQSSSKCVLIFAGLLIAAAANCIAAAQTAKPKAVAAGTANTNFTSQQAAAIKVAWDNLYRGYADLLATPPDVKGDTSRLEPHMKAAMNLLHQADPAVGEAPSNIPVMDKGQTRAAIFSATKGHLEKAKRTLEGATTSSTYVDQALQHIGAAETELAAAQAAPAK
jgi:hypothetical protein